jgi:hypothetical protein
LWRNSFDKICKFRWMTYLMNVHCWTR